ncbi:glutamate racemase [Patescibacteria group bacterium]
MDKRPIGVFDSGVGGLTVVKAIKRILPNESVVYLGDTARVPYGTRSQSTVQDFADDDVDFLITKNVKCIVIACNTASAQAYEYLRNRYDIPLFEVITPASEKAVNLTKTRNIIVMATSGTIASGAYEREIEKSGRKIRLTQLSCPLLVPLIEEGETGGDLIDLALSKYLQDFSINADTLILGCTHYPVIKESIRQRVGSDVKLVDSGVESAMVLKKYLEQHEMISNKRAIYEYYVTDLSDSFRKSAEVFLGEEVGEKIKKAELSDVTISV